MFGLPAHGNFVAHNESCHMPYSSDQGRPSDLRFQDYVAHSLTGVPYMPSVGSPSCVNEGLSAALVVAINTAMAEGYPPQCGQLHQ